MFSSAKDEWATPQEFFDLLNEAYNFTLNPCALPHNAKCKKYYTPEENGLLQDWEGEIVFCNPPYGRAIVDWVRKCSEEAKKPSTTVVGPSSSSYRHTLLPRLHLPQGAGDPFRPRASAFQRERCGRAVPVHGGNLLGPQL